MSTRWPIEIDPVFGCHLWTRTLDRDGYGISYRTGHGTKRAHIAVWEEAKGSGSVPDGLELDHTCRRRHCVNLDHLEPVTRAVNELRKSLAYRARPTLCRRKHDLRIHGAVTPEGGIVCRWCNRIARQQG